MLERIKTIARDENVRTIAKYTAIYIGSYCVGYGIGTLIRIAAEKRV